jgi:hypothetical protein
VAQFEDHELWYPGMHHSNTLYITDTWVVSLCRVSDACNPAHVLVVRLVPSWVVTAMQMDM